MTPTPITSSKPWRFTSDGREKQAEDMLEMLDWLDVRPGLPLPIEGAWAMAEENDQGGDAFHTMVSPGELGDLARHFDKSEPASDKLGIRRRFGSVAYEVLVGEASLTRRLDGQILVKRRREHLAGMVEMVRWLRDRPRIPFGSYAEMRCGALVFHTAAGGGERRGASAREDEFDRIDRLAGLPAYVDPVLRLFDGGVGLELRFDGAE